jgi:hypothetical protein
MDENEKRSLDKSGNISSNSLATKKKSNKIHA